MKKMRPSRQYLVALSAAERSAAFEAMISAYGVQRAYEAALRISQHKLCVKVDLRRIVWA